MLLTIVRLRLTTHLYLSCKIKFIFSKEFIFFSLFSNSLCVEKERTKLYFARYFSSIKSAAFFSSEIFRFDYK